MQLTLMRNETDKKDLMKRYLTEMNEFSEPMKVR